MQSMYFTVPADWENVLREITDYLTVFSWLVSWFYSILNLVWLYHAAVSFSFQAIVWFQETLPM